MYSSTHLGQLGGKALGVEHATGEPGGCKVLELRPACGQLPREGMQAVHKVHRQVVTHRRLAALPHCVEHRREACAGGAERVRRPQKMTPEMPLLGFQLMPDGIAHHVQLSKVEGLRPSRLSYVCDM